MIRHNVSVSSCNKKITVSQRGLIYVQNVKKESNWNHGINGLRKERNFSISKKKYPVLDCDQVNADLLKRKFGLSKIK